MCLELLIVTSANMSAPDQKLPAESKDTRNAINSGIVPSTGPSSSTSIPPSPSVSTSAASDTSSHIEAEIGDCAEAVMRDSLFVEFNDAGTKGDLASLTSTDMQSELPDQFTYFVEVLEVVEGLDQELSTLVAASPPDDISRPLTDNELVPTPPAPTIEITEARAKAAHAHPSPLSTAFRPGCTAAIDVEQVKSWILDVGVGRNKKSLLSEADRIATMVVEDSDFDTEGDLASLTSTDMHSVGVSLGNARSLGSYLGGCFTTSNNMDTSPVATPYVTIKQGQPVVASSDVDSNADNNTTTSDVQFNSADRLQQASRSNPKAAADSESTLSSTDDSPPTPAQTVHGSGAVPTHTLVPLHQSQEKRNLIFIR